jgi:hypothetical protein
MQLKFRKTLKNQSLKLKTSYLILFSFIYFLRN